MRKPISDEEYVARIRRALAVHTRWRKWLIGIYAALLLTVIGLCVAVLDFLVGFGRFLGAHGPALQGFIIGASCGGSIVILGIQCGANFVNAMRGWRTERLLIRYHDALVESSREQTGQEAVLPAAERSGP